MKYGKINRCHFKGFEHDKLVNLEINDCIEGETIEIRVEKMLNSNEPITDAAPLIYTEKENGVEAQYDIRTDKWDVALDAIAAGDRIVAAEKAEMKKKADAEKVEANKAEANKAEANKAE